MALDPTLISRHEAIAAQAEWTLPAIERDAATSVRVLPPMLRGDFADTYLTRKRVTHSSIDKVDAIRPGFYEANISRRLGFKSRYGYPTFIYWRHIPMARIVANGDKPHIFISPFHVGGKAQITRAMFALNPLLDYLMTGVRLDMDGVSIARRHETTAWPKMMGKPAIYIPVMGNTAHAFWTAKTFEFCYPKAIAFKGGEEWPDPEPWGVAPDDILAGLT